MPFSLRVENIWAFENNLKVKIYGKGGFYFGFYDYNGKVVFPVNFKKITDFEFGNNKHTQYAIEFGNNNSLAKVFFPSGSFFYINKDLKCVEYDGHSCPEE